MTIAGITLRNSQVNSLISLSPDKEQYRQRSLSGVNREALTLNYTHKYVLNLQSLSREEYIYLYNALLSLDQADAGQMTVSCESEIKSGLVHIPQGTEYPATITFDFDITSINPEPTSIYYNMSIPVSVYVAVV